MRYTWFFGAVVLAVVIVTLSGSAHADAKQHFLAGQDYYAQGRYEKAIEEFEEAYRLDPRPKLLFNMAQTYEKMANLANTVTYLRKYLKDDPSADDKVAIETKIANLEARIAATGVSLTCNVKDAIVYVDEQKVGITPVLVTVPIAPGTHRLRVAKRGFADFEITLAISLGQTIPVDAQLKVAAVVGSVAPPTPVPGGDPTGPQPEITDVAPPSTAAVSADTPAGPGEKSRTFMDVLPWTVAGVGAAAVIVGFGVFGIQAKQQNDEGKALIADVIGWPGVALAVGGTIWGIVRVRSHSKKETAVSRLTVLPVVGTHQAGLAAAVQF